MAPSTAGEGEGSWKSLGICVYPSKEKPSGSKVEKLGKSRSSTGLWEVGTCSVEGEGEEKHVVLLAETDDAGLRVASVGTVSVWTILETTREEREERKEND